MLKQVGLLPLFFCVISGFLWISLPLSIQSYIESLISKENPATSASFYIFGILISILLIDLAKYYLFFQHRPPHFEANSFVSKVYQDKIWTMELPTFIKNSIISIGTLGQLAVRNHILFLAVTIWCFVSFSIQFFISNKIEKTANYSKNSNIDLAHALEIQYDLMKWNVIGANVSIFIRLTGQIVIYATSFILISDSDLKKILPILLANLELVNLSLDSLSMLFIGIPRIQELKVYLNTKISESSTSPLSPPSNNSA